MASHATQVSAWIGLATIQAPLAIGPQPAIERATRVAPLAAIRVLVDPVRHGAHDRRDSGPGPPPARARSRAAARCCDRAPGPRWHSRSARRARQAPPTTGACKLPLGPSLTRRGALAVFGRHDMRPGLLLSPFEVSSVARHATHARASSQCPPSFCLTLKPSSSGQRERGRPFPGAWLRSRTPAATPARDWN
jgi:hypothetical protein